jgi:hypothetical protein
VSTSPRSDVIQWHDRSKIQLLEHIASLEKEVSIESQRATHYREQWQISILALKEQENSIRSLCENSRRYESDAEASKQRIKRLEDIINRAHLAFFSDSSDRKVSIAMHRILDEEVRKESP